MAVEKMGNSHVVPEKDYVSRKNKDRKYQRRQLRQNKRDFDYNEDKQSLGKHSVNW